MNKDEILDALEDEREKFLEAIDGLSDEDMQAPGVVGEWSIKDILSHLNAWEAELVRLLWQAKGGQRPTTVHFSDLSVDERNAQWHEANRARPLERVLADFEAVRKQTLRRVDEFSDEALNDPQRYPWLKGYPLWEWVANDSFKHEAEHAAQIMEWRARKNSG
jgi:hypothetical protein